VEPSHSRGRPPPQRATDEYLGWGGAASQSVGLWSARKNKTKNKTYSSKISISGTGTWRRSCLVVNGQ
jgi:hypothetical protein